MRHTSGLMGILWGRCFREATVLMLLLIVWINLAAAPGQVAAPRHPLTVEEIVRQTKSGISEEIVVTSIKKSGKAFDLSTEEILELKRSGVSEAVIRIMVDPSQPYTPPAPPQPKAIPPQIAAPKKPSNPIIEKLPPEPGVYLGKEPGEFVRLPFRTLTVAKGRKGVFSKKPSVFGHLVGAHSSTQISMPDPEFFLRLPEKAAIEEVLLLLLDGKQDRREIELGKDPSSPVFPTESVKVFESKELDPGVFLLSVGALEPGEYLFLLLGSADEKKGIAGKGYDFTRTGTGEKGKK